MRRNQRGYRRKKIFYQDYFDQRLVKYLAISVGTLLVLLLCVAIFYSIRQSILNQQFLADAHESIRMANAETASSKTEEIQTPETDTTFTLTAVGNIMCTPTQNSDAYQKETNDYDFFYVFEDINRYFKTSDVVVGNLETTFSGKEHGYQKYYNSPDEFAYPLKKLGIDVLSTASNHCLDMGFDGLCRTIDVLNNNNISHLGTYQTKEEQDKILFKYVKGIKIAFLNYTYGINKKHIPSDKNFCVNVLDKELIKNDIEKAKTQGANVIVSCVYWGTEQQATVSSNQKEWSDFLFQNGVDVILGNNPYLMQSMEKRTITLEDGSQKDGFVVYSLGNFVCDGLSESGRTSVILNLKITKHVDGRLSFTSADSIPIYLDKNTSSKTRQLKLLDMKKVIYNYEAGIDSSIGEKNYQKLKARLEEIEAVGFLITSKNRTSFSSF